MKLIQKSLSDFRTINCQSSLLDRCIKSTQNILLKPSSYNIEINVTSKEIVVFNTISEALIVLDKEELDLLYLSKSSTLLEDKIKVLYDNGFIVPVNENEIFKVDMAKYSQFSRQSNIKQFTILPTQACNARCFYCFEQGMEAKSMSKKTVQDVINFIVSNITQSDIVVFDWFGGEPMVGANIIDEIINGVKNTCKFELQYKSIMISNGVLFTKELLKKAVSDWKLERIQLTVDGTEDEHNHRKNLVDSKLNAYNQLKKTIQYFLKQGIEVFTRINFDINNYEQRYGIYEDFKEFSKNNNFILFPAMLKHHFEGSKAHCFEEEDYGEIYSQIYKELVEYGYIKYVDELLPNVKRKPCLAGNLNSIVIDPYGDLFKCPQEFGQKDKSIGSCCNGIVYNDILSFWVKPNDQVSSDCSKCKMLPMCFGGCKYNLKDEVDISVCIKNRMIIEDMLKLTFELVDTNKIKIR